MHELVQLQKEKGAYSEIDIAIVAICSESIDGLEKMKEKSAVEFPILGESSGKLMDAFGLRDKSGNPVDGTDIFRPATIVLRKNGSLIWSDAVENYRVRPSPKEVFFHVSLGFKN
ncbi:MAG: peroxiredoxin family protein [Verrucomicrobiales bacterium]